MIRQIVSFVKGTFASKQTACTHQNFSSLIKSEESQNTFDEIVKSIKHVAIIADGNRRWARNNGLPLRDGYYKFLDVLPPVLKFGWKSGIHTISVFLLSSDNVDKRPMDQLDIIYEVYSKLIDLMLDVAKSMRVKMVHVGRKDRMPAFFVSKLDAMERETVSFEQYVFNLVLDYRGQDEILHALKGLFKAEPNILPEQLTSKKLDDFMYTAGQKYSQPDLLIRPGGAARLSGFMSWNVGASELHFSPKLFPDFTVDDFREAILQFKPKDRRFGK